MTNNLIPQGYKLTDLGVIPEDWAVVRLGEIGNFSKGQGISKSEANSGDINAVRYGELYTDYNNYISSIKTHISPEVAKLSKRIEYGDILFACSGETKEDIGKNATLINRAECYAGGDIIIFRPKNQDSLFLGFALNSNGIQAQKASKGQGDAVVHISKNSLASLVVALPGNISEQQKIAEALRDIDLLIEGSKQKIAKKRAIKEGVMQQLLTGKKRLDGFSEPWVEKYMEEDLVFQVGFPFQSSYFNIDNNGIRLVRNRDLKSDDQIIHYSGKYLNDFIVDNGDLLISMDGDFSPTVWSKGKALLNQRVGRLKSQGKWHLLYFYYALAAPLNTIQNEVGATTVKHLSHKDIDKISIFIPPTKAEQQAIAQILTDIDNEISELEQKQKKYTTIKQGALQNLLTGQIRL